jgi:hypothetical protein
VFSRLELQLGDGLLHQRLLPEFLLRSERLHDSRPHVRRGQ